jgi:hypothetical protein
MKKLCQSTDQSEKTVLMESADDFAKLREDIWHIVAEFT